MANWIVWCVTFEGVMQAQGSENEMKDLYRDLVNGSEKVPIVSLYNERGTLEATHKVDDALVSNFREPVRRMI